MFVHLLWVLGIVEEFINCSIPCSAQGRAFIHFARFTEFIGVKPFISQRDVNSSTSTGSYYENMLLLRSKLVKLFDENLRVCYPENTHENKVQITPVKIFDEKSFNGVEKSFMIKTNSTKATVLYYHGGGFLCGETTTYVNILTPWLYNNNLDCLVVDYGLCPFHTPEDIVSQARQAYDYLINTVRVDPRTIIFAGESAGANIALHVVLDLVREGNDKLPAGVLLFSPWVDLTLSTESWKSSGADIVLTDSMCRLGEKLNIWSEGEDPRKYSPLFMDLSHLPPVLVSWGGQERLRDESEQLCNRLDDCGVNVTRDPHEGMFHAFTLFHKYIPEGKWSLDKAASCVRKWVS